MHLSAHDVDEGARVRWNVEGRRSTRRALDAGFLNHVGPVFSAGRSDPRPQDVTINVRRYAIHRCVWVRPPTRGSAVRAGPRRAVALSFNTATVSAGSGELSGAALGAAGSVLGV